MAEADKKTQQGDQPQDDQQQKLDHALERGAREDLLGDMEENRNLTGSTTWETLDEKEEGSDEQRGRS